MPFLSSGQQILTNSAAEVLKSVEFVFTGELTTEGAWIWYTTPQAVYYNGKTFFGYVDESGVVKVRQYIHSTRAVSSAFTLRSVGTQDDHHCPSLLVRDSDKRLLVFYVPHLGANFYMRISTNPEDATAWGAEVNLDSSLGSVEYTYCQAMQLLDEDNDPIYIFYRSQDIPNRWTYSKSIDGGATWAAGTNLFLETGKRAYFKAAKNGEDRIDFIVTDGAPLIDSDVSIYHFYYQGGNYYKSDGTQIVASLPLSTANLTLVYDGTAIDSWNWDVAADSDGNPVLLFSTFPTPASDHRYNYAKWNGSSWVINEITTAGGTISSVNDYYSGGMELDPSDPRWVYLSKQVGSFWEIYKAFTPDDGASWTIVAITSGSAVKNIRPVVIRNHAADLKVLWGKGTYSTFEIYDLNIYGTSI